MKFIEIYNNLAKKYLLEQDENFEMNQTSPEMAENQNEMQVPNTVDSQLPTEETIDLNEEKYKSLLLMIQKALIHVAKDNLDARNRLSDIQKVIEQTPMKAEKILLDELENLTNQFPKQT
jgi:hypothetical protein